MSKGFIFTLAFAFGAAAGSVVTWKLVQKKYEQMAHDEIEEIREYYASKDKDEATTEEKTDTDEEDTTEDDVPFTMNERTEYSSIAKKYLTNDDKGGEQPMSRREPYVISPAEFGEDDNYECLTLIYYNDGILADHDGNRIEDIESCIGYEALNHFGEYEDDSVYVRNDDTMMEYEVLLEENNYTDIVGVD